MKKRILSSLLAFVLLLSALPMGVYAAETRYSVAASPDQTTDVGKTVSMTVSVAGGSYNAYDLALTYDTARLTYVSGRAADKDASVTKKGGSVRVIGYGADKRRARKGKWRVPEKTLFLLPLLGGSIGALLGMRVFHHKTKHWYFVWGIPAILLAQIALAVWIYTK